MAAPKGNQFWKQRAKHGRDKIFENPENLWESACEYFEWCDANPFKKQEAKTINIGDYQSKVEIVELDVMRAYTWNGLHIFLDIYNLHSYKADPKYKDFSNVLTRIGEVIYTQKFTGAASGFFNSSIIARDLGLADKIEKQKTKIVVKRKNAD